MRPLALHSTTSTCLEPTPAPFFTADNNTMTSTADLDNQRPIISQCYRLHDLSHLVRDQRYHTERLMAEVSRRKANLLSSRRARPEYISDEDLLRLSNVLDLDAITRSLEDQDRRLEAELGNLLDKMTEYTLDESTGYSRWHHQPGDDAGGGGAAAAALRLAMGLVCILVLLSVLFWRCWC
ncbi:uncharacterized protein MYCGRDRAFT_106721 [Zymoseptoria tritici IPO323]|uniref:Uncharacterized protein n=1 Tax=Zymoseptoria tritici (strain CBS 115943 / IPO323) TaxID=336722 RepID=F9XSC3_ZYMTI|nr:uncharacterized protein MYCGRDRAFT_106721 [Zymoseptoria tritici IPO323]EGP81860.1 hypothetical protein MYCGRDRAFT_106721 [Zymoseptoria tritici IPO323]